MGYFNYHQKLKNKIQNGELETFAFVDEYKGICPALVLYFNDGKIFFVRSEKFDDYIKLFDIQELVFPC